MLRVHTHFLLKTLTYTKYSLTLTGKYKKSKVVVSWHCGRVQSQNDVYLHVIQKTMNDPHTVTQSEATMVSVVSVTTVRVHFSEQRLVIEPMVPPTTTKTQK